MVADKPKTYKQLQREWDRRLAKEGFVDAEQRDGNLKTWSSDYYLNYPDETRREAYAGYFRLAGQFLYSYQFETTVDRLVWEYHSQGKSIREIPKLLWKQRIRLKKSSVGVIIKRLAKEMIGDASK